MPPVCVLIPCFNEEQVVKATILAVLRSRHVRLSRVICIDDGSNDNTLALLHRFQHAQGGLLQVIAQTNKGKALALNRGLAEVGTEVFVCIDADTQVLPDTLAMLIGTLMDQRAAAVSGQMMVGGEGHGLVQRAQVCEYEVANNIERRIQSRFGCITVVPGAIGAFSTEAVRAQGGFSKRTLAEDAELTLLLLLAGHHVVHQPHAVALTEVPETLGQLFKQRLRWATGKLQVVLRQARPAFAGGWRARGIWGYMAINHCLVPLLFFPLYLLSFASLGAALFLPEVPPGLIVATCLVLLLQRCVSHQHYRLASRLDEPARRRVWLGQSDRPWLGTVLMSLVGCAAAWAGLARILLRCSQGWGKLTRRGSVHLPPIP